METFETEALTTVSCETPEIKEPAAGNRNTVLEEHTGSFLLAAFLYGVGFAVAFYKNYAGLTFPLITVATVAICGLFLKKSKIVWKRKNAVWIVPVVLLGISTMLTDNLFTIIFNTVGILLLLTVFMVQQVYQANNWHPLRYVCNVMEFYCSMITQVAAPFSNLGKSIRKKRASGTKNENLKPVLTGVFIGLPMLVFVMVLLNSADAIFSKYIGSGFHFLWKNIVFSPNIILIVALFLLGFFGIYAFLSALTLNNLTDEEEKFEKKNPVIAVTFTGMITAVYLVFCVIQVVFLFSGGLMLPEGYTYAEYAHQGFFQLLVLCVFNLALVLCCVAFFERDGRLKTMLLVFSGCTYVMILSSAYRMILYISCYHLTFLRMLVLWFLALLAVLLAGVMASIQKEKFPLFRFSVAAVTCFYLVLSFGHFDYWIASYNIAKTGGELTYEDASYLCSLSEDAAPALAKVVPRHQHKEGYELQDGTYWECPACTIEMYFEDIEEKTESGIRSFNFSRYRAREVAEEFLLNADSVAEKFWKLK